EKIPHVQRIRIHTRFLIGIPERITTSFLKKLSQRKKTLFIVIHTNHPKEIDEEVKKAIQKLLHLGIPILSQTVLLKGVNDNFATLKELFTSLINTGVIPYYLHHLDFVKGAHSFYVSPVKGKKLILKLRESLPGYGVPRYVQEIPHKKGKTLIL
ncbi:MAG: EF-P beta-lysylation protein EpmB, partial [Chlamydiota bacterium]